MSIRLGAAMLIALAIASGAMGARAATAVPGPVPDAGLVGRAQQEGKLVLYGVTQADAVAAIAKRFQTTYGIAVEWTRMESTTVPPRLLAETRSGHVEADVVLGEAGLETKQMVSADLFAAYTPPESREAIPGTSDPKGYWVPYALLTETICYNPAKVKAAGLAPPRSWSDLTAPAWRGKFALFKSSWEWYAALKRFYGVDRTDALMRAFAGNEPRLEESHQLGVELTGAGEVLAAVNVFGYACLINKAKGSSIEEVNPDPTIIEITTNAILKGAPHPNAARLFERWLLARDTQQWIVTDLGKVSARRDVTNNPALMGDKRIHYVVSDTSDLSAFNADIKHFNELFGIPG